MKERFSISNFQLRETGRVNDAILRATKEGIFEFVFEMVKADPQLVFCHDAVTCNIFSVAVRNRQAKIFGLIYGSNFKSALAGASDFSDGNTLLHIAGMSAPSTSLDHIAGAALQMQRELQW